MLRLYPACERCGAKYAFNDAIPAPATTVLEYPKLARWRAQYAFNDTVTRPATTVLAYPNLPRCTRI